MGGWCLPPALARCAPLHHSLASFPSLHLAIHLIPPPSRLCLFPFPYLGYPVEVSRLSRRPPTTANAALLSRTQMCNCSIAACASFSPPTVFNKDRDGGKLCPTDKVRNTVQYLPAYGTQLVGRVGCHGPSRPSSSSAPVQWPGLNKGNRVWPCILDHICAVVVDGIATRSPTRPPTLPLPTSSTPAQTACFCFSFPAATAYPLPDKSACHRPNKRCATPYTTHRRQMCRISGSNSRP